MALSPSIISFDYIATFNLLTTGGGTVVLSDNSVYSDAGDVAGICFTMTAPDGTVLYSNSNFGSPDLQPNGTNFTVPLPTFNGAVLFGQYTIVGTILDNENSQQYTLTKTANVVQPNKSCNMPSNYGFAHLGYRINCSGGSLVVSDLTVYTYNGVLGTPSYNIVVYPPTQLQLSPITSNVQYASISPIYNGIYTILLNSTASYNQGNNVFIVVPYTQSATPNVQCQINLCNFYCELDNLLNQSLNVQSFSPYQSQLLNNKLTSAFQEVGLIQIGIACGNDISKNVSQLEKILGVQCGCNTCPTGVPQQPTVICCNDEVNVVAGGSGDVTVSSSTVGITTTYTVDDYKYIVAIADDGSENYATSTLTIVGKTKTWTISLEPIVNALYQVKVNGSESTGGYLGQKIESAAQSISLSYDSVNQKLNEEVNLITLANNIESTNNSITANYDNGTGKLNLQTPTLSWQTLALDNFWIPYNPSYESPKYAIDSGKGLVYVRGLVQNQVGNINQIIGTLPSGARPNKNILRSVNFYSTQGSNQYAGQIIIDTSGNIAGNSSTFVGSSVVEVNLFAIFSLID